MACSGGGETGRGGIAHSGVWEIPFWIFGQQKWVSSITKNTSCQEIVKALFRNLNQSEENGASSYPTDPSQFSLVEKWRKIERPLNPASRVVKVWLAWGEDKSEVKLVVKRIQPQSPAESIKTSRRRKHSKVWRANQSKLDTVHPRCLYNTDKEKCKDSIQKLMKIIITQGNTIQSQLKGLSDKEEAIESFEQKMHVLRMKESGRDYLLQTYLDQLPENLADYKSHIAISQRQSKNLPRSKSTGFSSHGTEPSLSPPIYPCGIPPDEIKLWIDGLEKLHTVNTQITIKEEELAKLHQNTRQQYTKQKTSKVVVPELEEILRLPPGALEKELLLSEKEVQQVINAISTTQDELLKIERDLTSIQERKLAGDIYIRNLISDLETAESEGVELQKEFDWILSLPPSAFASKEMLEWLKRDFSDGDAGDTDSELGLDLSPEQTTAIQSRNILLPDQVHPPATDPARSSSTGSTSSGFSSDIHSLVSPEPEVLSKLRKPPLPPKGVLSHKFADLDNDDCNSDTGLSSLNSSAEDQFQLDTLV